MASLDFANMTKQDLSKLRRHAIRAGERPSVENNYFATTFSAGISNKQPTDYIPTALFKTWCEHHGPSNHVTAECRDGNGVTTKPPESGLRAEENARRMIQFGRYLDKALAAMRIKQRREKQAAKRRQRTDDGQGEVGMVLPPLNHSLDDDS